MEASAAAVALGHPALLGGFLCAEEHSGSQQALGRARGKDVGIAELLHRLLSCTAAAPNRQPRLAALIEAGTRPYLHRCPIVAVFLNMYLL